MKGVTSFFALENPAVLALVFEDGTALSLTESTNRSPEVTAPLGDATALEDAVFQMTLPADLFRDPDAADELRLSVRRANGDPPPPGHSTNLNDGPGTSPGNPGASQVKKVQPAASAANMQTSAKAAPVELVDWTAWDTAQEPAPSGNASPRSESQIEHHWQQLLATLQQLDAQRSANDVWSDPNRGAGFGLTGLAATSAPNGLSGPNAVGLTAGSGTHLASFSGLKEGLASLA